MQQYLPIVFSLAFVIGCAKSDSPTVGTAQSASIPSAQPAPAATSTSYPEKVEVERLLVRAGEHQQNGKFEQALALVKEALQLDPSSPSATALQSKLEDIIRKI